MKYLAVSPQPGRTQPRLDLDHNSARWVNSSPVGVIQHPARVHPPLLVTLAVDDLLHQPPQSLGVHNLGGRA